MSNTKSGAPQAPEESSRAMFVARLSSGDQDTMMSCRDVLALLDDCDMLAAREDDRPNCPKCKGTGEAPLMRGAGPCPTCGGSGEGAPQAAIGTPAEPLPSIDEALELARYALRKADTNSKIIAILETFRDRIRAALYTRAPEPADYQIRRRQTDDWERVTKQEYELFVNEVYRDFGPWCARVLYTKEGCHRSSPAYARIGV